MSPGLQSGTGSSVIEVQCLHSGHVWRRQRDDHVLVVMVSWDAEDDGGLK